MNIIRTTITTLAAVTTLACTQGAIAATGTLDGHTLTIEYGADLGLGSGWQAVKSQTFVVGSGVEVQNWALDSKKTVLWNIDASDASLVFTYVGSGDFMNYGSPDVLGFRVIDSTASLPSFAGVSVTNTAYVANAHGNLLEGFDPVTALTFDANNIVVNINSSMYHHVAMPGMGDPLRDAIALNLQFAAAVPEPSTYVLTACGLLALAGLSRRKPTRAS